MLIAVKGETEAGFRGWEYSPEAPTVVSYARKAHRGSKGAPYPSWGRVGPGEAPSLARLRAGGTQLPPLAHAHSPCSPHMLGAPWQEKGLFLPCPCQAPLLAEVTGSFSRVGEKVRTAAQ